MLWVCVDGIMQMHRQQFHKLLTGFRTMPISFLINVQPTLLQNRKLVSHHASKQKQGAMWVVNRSEIFWGPPPVEENKSTKSTKTTLSAQNRFSQSHFVRHRYKCNVKKKKSEHTSPSVFQSLLLKGHKQRNCAF